MLLPIRHLPGDKTSNACKRQNVARAQLLPLLLLLLLQGAS
jgi:hypothetical protein